MNGLTYVPTDAVKGKVLYRREIVARVTENSEEDCHAVDCRGREMSGTVKEVFDWIHSVKWSSVIGANPLTATQSHMRMEQKRAPSKKRFALS